jgi:hypothetical protein
VQVHRCSAVAKAEGDKTCEAEAKSEVAESFSDSLLDERAHECLSIPFELHSILIHAHRRVGKVSHAGEAGSHEEVGVPVACCGLDRVAELAGEGLHQESFGGGHLRQKR